MKQKSMESKLNTLGYSALFLGGDNKLANSLWKEGENIKVLKSIIHSKSSTPFVRFLANEVFRHFDVAPEAKYTSEIAEAYAYALANTSWERGNPVQLNGNLWGLLYEEDDCGYLGSQFIACGNAAIPHLTPLLEDNAGKILYEGSEEATLGNAYQYRIKDFAAFYISKIKNLPIRFHQDIDARDEEIMRFKLALSEA